MDDDYRESDTKIQDVFPSMRWKYHLFEVQSSVMQVCSTDHMPQDEDLQSLPVYLAMRRYRNAHVFCGNDS